MKDTKKCNLRRLPKRCFAVLLAILTLFSCLSTGVSALGSGDTVQVTGTKDWVQGFYYDFNGNFGTGHYGQHQWLKANGQTAYCVEPTKSLTAGSKTIDEIWAGFTKEQRDLVTAAYIYGYNGSARYGYSDATVYVATQAVMWAIYFNAFNNANEETLLSCAFAGKTSAANRAAGRAAYAKIKEQIVSHYTRPSFSTSNKNRVDEKKLTLKYNVSTGCYEGSVTDTNGVLSGYNFSCSGVKFTKSGNTLYISTNQVLNDVTVTGERTSNTYCDSLPALVAIYCIGSDQTTAMAINRKDPVNAFFSLETESKGNLKIHKVSEVGGAVGVVFNVSGNGIDVDVTIDTLDNPADPCNGYVLVEGILPGTYTVTEKNVDPKYYVAPFGTTQQITVLPNETNTVYFGNYLKRGALKIQKTSEDGNPEGYSFLVRGTSVGGEHIEFNMTTDSQGVATKTDIPIGEYYVSETNCPSYMVTPSGQLVSIIQDTTTVVNVENKYKRGDLVLSKTDADTGDNIITNDAVFTVYEWDKNIGTYKDVCDLEYSSALDESKYGCTSGYYASNLPITASNEGKYRVTEKTAPEGYVTDCANYDVTLIADGQVIRVNDGVVTNKIQKAKINLTKTDKETGKALEGAIYSVYSKSDIYANGVLVCGANTLVDTLVTDKAGKAMSTELYLGEYYLKEVTAPYGYVLDTKQYDVTLSYDANASEVFVQTESISDIPQKATITVTKTDAETNKTISAPAKYGVYAKEDIIVNGDVKYKANQLVDTLTTNKNGKAVSKELYLGTYYVKELEAPNGYNKNNNTYFVPLLYKDQNITVFNFDVDDKDISQKGKISVSKTDSETGNKINLTATFEIYARNKVVVNGDVKYNAGQLVATLNTTNGTVATDWLPLGDYFVKEKSAPVGYVINKDEYDVSLTYDSAKESVFISASITDVPQKGTITVSKVDTETNIPVANAVYVIKAAEDIILNGDVKYRAGQKVDEITTDTNGQAKSIPLYLGKYNVKEKTAPKPYTRDKNTYDISLVYHSQNVSIFNELCEVTNLAQKAKIKLTKTDSETNKALANAVYEIYTNEQIAVNGDVKYQKNELVDTITTADNGEAISKELYLGSYRLVEKTAPNGYVLDTDEHIAVLDYHGQEVDVFTNGYTAQNAPQKANIELVKTDRETGLPLENGVYEIYATSDISLNGDIKYTANQLVDTLTTDKNGKATSKLLYLGDYYIVEKTAPFGYVLNTEKIDVTLSYKGQTVSTYTETVTTDDIAQKGIITISKSGEVFSTVTNDDNIYQPEYSVKPLSGSVYDIIADEDIVTADGTVRAKKGDIVDTVTTGEDGIATSKELYLGSYKVVEKTAPFGMVLNLIPSYVTLSYAGQTKTLTYGSASFVNERQKVTIELNKTLEEDELFGIGKKGEIKNIKFGLYASEEMIASDGSVIPKDSLLEILSLNEDGSATFHTDLPVGVKAYVKEYSTDEHYILSDEIYPVTFIYAGQDTAGIHISLNNGEVIENTLKRGNIYGKKIDDDGFEICGALMGLFRPDETEFIEENALMTCSSNEIGVFGFLNVPYGNYIVREIEPPEGFNLNETVYPVAITENGQTVEIEVVNRFITGSVMLIKADSLDNDILLSGFTFEVYVDADENGEFNPDIDKLVDTLKENSQGTYSLTGLRYNGYFLHEAKQSGNEYLMDDGYYYFEIREEGETVTISNSDNGLFVNTPLLGSLIITKSDVSDGKLLPNVGFRIRNEQGEIIREGYTDENGAARFDNLRYGKYTYQEFDAADGYQLDETEYLFEITQNGEIVTVTMTNEKIPVEIPKTGSKTVTAQLSAVAVTALLSAAWITVSQKKRKSKVK